MNGILQIKEILMIVFGVGCFNFGINLEMGVGISPKEYATALEKHLYESDHVQRNSVVIEYEDTFGYILEKPTEDEGLGNGYGFPLPMFFSLQFDIIIPKHIQEEISEESGLDCIVLKQIRVKINETYYGPVALIQLESDDIDEGSKAVKLLRLYLHKHFDNKYVYFENIGPSPFHADFSISAAPINQAPNLNENGFLSKIIPRKGYDEIIFLYSKDLYKSDQVALEKLFNSLDDELSLFYLMIKYRAQKIESWEKIDTLYNKLIETSSKRNWISRIKLMLSFDGNLTHQLLHQLTMFEIMTINHSSSLHKGYETIFKKGLPVYLQSRIDKELHYRSEDYPTKQVIYYLEFHEKRSMQVWQTWLLAISALLGAAIGSVITASLN